MPAARLCKCGRAPHRKGQRNCAFCNREANAKYRQSLKRMEARFKNANAKSVDQCPNHESNSANKGKSEQHAKIEKVKTRALGPF